jgi:cellulose synthase (UDP-forming)
LLETASFKAKHCAAMSEEVPERSSVSIPRFRYVRPLPSGARLTRFLTLLSLISLTIGCARLLHVHWVMWMFLPCMLFVLLHEVLVSIAGLVLPAETKRSLDSRRCAADSGTKNQKNAENWPLVDVLLPVCGEPLEILRRTWEAVARIRYPAFAVTVLDDAGSAQVRDMAESFGFRWLARPNAGEHAKSGNLAFGFENTAGEFYLVLDADFAPHPRILQTMVSRMLKEPDIGILQTPQYFDPKDSTICGTIFSYASAASVEDFYRLVQPFRNQCGAAMCVGTSAMYRRKVIERSGFSLAPASEDVKQGLMVNKEGFRVEYKAEILSAGLTPQTYRAFQSQQTRWCYGSWLNLTSKLFWSVEMSTIARVVWLGNLVHYLRSASTALLPLQLVVLAFVSQAAIHWINALWFVPLWICRWLMWPYRFVKWKPGLLVAGRLKSIIHLRATLMFWLGHPLHWVPTGSATAKADSSGKRSTEHTGAVIYLAIISALSIAAVLQLVPPWRWEISLVSGWLILETVVCIAALGAVLSSGNSVRQ